MPFLHLPVRPDLDRLREQAKALHLAIRAGEPEALADLAEHHPRGIDPASAKLTDAQLVLARKYRAPSWQRLVLACRLVAAIWRDDLEAVRALAEKHPRLLREDALVRPSNWGPPLSYAANLGRDRIIRMLYEHGARDLEHAIDRATLQGQIGTARMLYDLMGRPPLPDDALGGPAYTLSAAGTELMLELGVRVVDERGARLAPVEVVLGSDSRKPREKHAILEMYAAHGLALPDTAPMALHRGRIDLLEEHLRRDPALLTRTFAYEEIYPPEMGCHGETLATYGTPLAGATLLHLCMDYGEMEIAEWLLDRGMPVDARAAVDAEGLGGHTALFSTVVSQVNFWMNYARLKPEAPFTRFLLDHGADPNARASLRKKLHPGYDDDRVTEVRDATPLTWGRRFHNQLFVNEAALRMIEGAGGHE